MQNTGTGFTPAVDVVIAVHSSGRPIERAVASAFDGGLAANQDGGVRVSVVCHNIEAAEIRRRLPAETAGQVRWLTCHDGIASLLDKQGLILRILVVAFLAALFWHTVVAAALP